MHLFHKWSRWEVREALFRVLIRHEVPGYVQIRTCSECGKTQVRTLASH